MILPGSYCPSLLKRRPFRIPVHFPIYRLGLSCDTNISYCAAVPCWCSAVCYRTCLSSSQNGVSCHTGRQVINTFRMSLSLLVLLYVCIGPLLTLWIAAMAPTTTTLSPQAENSRTVWEELFHDHVVSLRMSQKHFCFLNILAYGRNQVQLHTGLIIHIHPSFFLHRAEMRLSG